MSMGRCPTLDSMCSLFIITNLTTQVSRKTYISSAFLTFSSAPLWKYFTDLSVTLHPSSFCFFMVQFVWNHCTELHVSLSMQLSLLQVNNSMAMESSVQHNTNPESLLSSPVITTSSLQSGGDSSIWAAGLMAEPPLLQGLSFLATLSTAVSLLTESASIKTSSGTCSAQNNDEGACSKKSEMP